MKYNLSNPKIICKQIKFFRFTTNSKYYAKKTAYTPLIDSTSGKMYHIKGVFIREITSASDEISTERWKCVFYMFICVYMETKRPDKTGAHYTQTGISICRNVFFPM